MLEEEFHISNLIVKHLQSRLAPEEQDELEKWISATESNKLLFNEILDAQKVSKDLKEFNSQDETAIWNKALFKMQQERRKRLQFKMFPNYKFIAAALILITISVALYFSLSNSKKRGEKNVAFVNNFYPGKKAATLTLANGNKINLSDVINGKLAEESGVNVSKTADGKVLYTVTSEEQSNVNSYNMISTGQGQEYQIVLPDGTNVWLNAASSIKFPTSFSKLGSRKIELVGEAYFEVHKDEAKPFIVLSKLSDKYQEIKVLGTHFNINGYENEDAIKTTLLEGSVLVKVGGITKTLKPGQQSAVSTDIKVYDVNTETAVDWKAGYFYLADENIQLIMRKIARWYDVEVVYKGKIPEVNFGGKISKAKNLYEVLKVLETTGSIHFKIDGRRIIVMK
ncbi:FecR family protein [Pedobacter hiemivivus]|uniref:FecR family protein n=1 Tax=Pedobacter hiemivivus TaxID=2530454 RepID=A0A4R0NI30_9SPHI|nr:FecR family protein [Pedobacter hiemivivus]TCC98454.1 FecR family protein [Pedobacter hiemivivus]